jgi:hypothetical protein
MKLEASLPHHKRPPTVHILSQINQVYAATSYFLDIPFNIILCDIV